MRLAGVVSIGILLCCCGLQAQNTPIAIVPVEGVKLTGALDIAEGKAMIAASGTVTAGDHAATITLPHRGNLKLCPTTKVTLTADSSIASAGAPGLMLALDKGAVEAGFATGKNSDVILTPDFRILVSGPGTASVQVRLGEKGDTCVDNRGPNAAYVTVSSIFDGGIYRVQADQRVMFQHGSLREVVDQEKESCGCPPETPQTTLPNAFPLAQSAGLAPLTPASTAPVPPGTVSAQVTASVAFDAAKPADPAPAQPDLSAPKEQPEKAPAKAAKPEAKAGFFHGLGRFFRKIFGG